MIDFISRLDKRYPTADGPFVWTNGKAWIYAYGNRDPIGPMAMAFVVAGPVDRADEVELRRLRSARRAASALAVACDVPFGEIWFSVGPTGLEDLRLDRGSLTEVQLRDWFASCGLRVNAGQVVKPVNRGMDSLFAEWLRANLGGIVISNIDLLRTNSDDGAVEFIYELKRSFYSLEGWSPFRKDFANFALLSHVASRAGVDFRILYNVYSQVVDDQPRVDDASQVALFSFSRTDQRSYRLGSMSFDDFVDGVVR